MKSGEVSPAELVVAAVQNALVLNPKLNAIMTPNFELAIERAAKMPRQGAFAGVPFVVKDNLDVAGLVTSHGSHVYENNIARDSAPLVLMNEAVGINLIGKANMPEVGALAVPEGHLLGPCRNSWNLMHNSGGSASAVAAGTMPLAHASDGGGSIRISASICDLFGLKSSRRRVIWGSTDQAGYAVDNCVSRTVRDSAMYFALGQDLSPTAPFPPLPRVTGPSQQRLTIELNRGN